VSRGDLGDVRIGERWFKLADNEQFFAQTGLRGMRRPWRSLFAERASIQGAPGIENVREDDLRWLQTSWQGGEGQAVIDPASDASFRRFESSLAVSLARPSEIRLARQMVQMGLTGAAPTTIEGNTWTDDIGVSTDVGNDTTLNNVGDRVRTDASLANGTWQIDFYGYMEGAPVIEGNAFVQVQGPTSDSATDKLLKAKNAEVRTVTQNPIDGDLDLIFAGTTNYSGTIGNEPPLVKCSVVNVANGAVVKQNTFGAHPLTGIWGGTLAFKALAGKTYRYFVKVTDMGSATAVVFDKVTVDEKDAKGYLWEVRDTASTVFASGTADLNGVVAAGVKVASATIVITGGPLTRRFRVERDTGASRKMRVDKVVYTTIAMDDPRICELGQGDRFWLVDVLSGGTPGVFVYDAQNNEWDAVANFASASVKAIALAHSESFEFVIASNDLVYRASLPSTITEYINAGFPGTGTGLAVGGNRLLVLSESKALGSEIFSYELEGTPPLALGTPVYSVGNKGVEDPNPDVPHRMAGTKNGCVFFANQGPDCWVYQWDGVAGVALAQMPRGYRGQAIAHAQGQTWLAGSLPAPDTDGTTRRRPSVFQIAPDGVPLEVEVQLWREGDPSTTVVGIQLYATDLFIQTEVAAVGATNKRMRLWRISLRTPIAAFLEQEITTDQGQAAGAAGGIAINHRDRIMVWRVGAPYLSRETYPTSGYGSLRSSRYAYGVAEEKQLLGILLTGSFPAGTSAEVWYATDDGTLTLGGTFTGSGGVQIAAPDVQVALSYLQTEVRLFTTDAAQTPVIYSYDVLALSQVWEKSWELLLLCADQTAVWNLDGKQLPGSAGVAYVLALADGGGMVEFEDAYSTRIPEERQVRVVTVENPDTFYLRRGEGLLRVRLRERVIG